MLLSVLLSAMLVTAAPAQSEKETELSILHPRASPNPALEVDFYPFTNQEATSISKRDQGSTKRQTSEPEGRRGFFGGKRERPESPVTLDENDSASTENQVIPADYYGNSSSLDIIKMIMGIESTKNIFTNIISTLIREESFTSSVSKQLFTGMLNLFQSFPNLSSQTFMQILASLETIFMDTSVGDYALSYKASVVNLVGTMIQIEELDEDFYKGMLMQVGGILVASNEFSQEAFEQLLVHTVDPQGSSSLTPQYVSILVATINREWELQTQQSSMSPQ